MEIVGPSAGRRHRSPANGGGDADCTYASSTAGSLTVHVPLQPARGAGGSCFPRLYEAEVDGKLYVAWKNLVGELRAAPARCPHRPRRPTLHVRGILDLDGDVLICAIHGCLQHRDWRMCVVP